MKCIEQKLKCDWENCIELFKCTEHICCFLPSAFGSLPCLAQSRPCDVKSTSCIDLSASGLGPRPPTRPRVLLKAPTLAEMEEMNISEVSCERLPCQKR